MTDEECIRTLSKCWCMDYSEMIKIIHSYIESDICNEYYRLTYSKPPIYISPVKVKTLKERLEEATMHSDCEFCVKRDICTRDVPEPCRYRYTEEERIADQASDNYGSILAGMYLHKTYQKKKEDNEMKATSVQNIKNVKDICIAAAAFPMGGPGESLTIRVHTDDDVFEFNFDGVDLVQKCKKAGLFSGLEKEQKIRELEKKNKSLSEVIGKTEEENKNLRIQVKVLNDIKKENAELKDKLLKVLWTVADCEINKGGNER